MSVNDTQLAHLALANEVRTEQTRVHWALKKGELDFADFLDETPRACCNLMVSKVLRWLPNLSHQKANRIMHVVDIDDYACVGDLTQAEKYALHAAIPPRRRV